MLSNRSFKELVELHKSGEYKKGYMDFLRDLNILYTQSLNNSRSLLDAIKHSIKVGNKTTISGNLLIQDVIDFITKDTVPTFNKYGFVSPDNTIHIKISATIPSNHIIHKVPTDELEFMINKGGIDVVMDMLESLEGTNLHAI